MTDYFVRPPIPGTTEDLLWPDTARIFGTTGPPIFHFTRDKIVILKMALNRQLDGSTVVDFYPIGLLVRRVAIGYLKIREKNTSA